MRHNFIAISLIFFLLLNYQYATSQNCGGLSFVGSSSDLVERTSYSVFEENINWVDDSLKFEFDLSLFENRAIGHILTCKSDKVELFNISVSKYRVANALTINLNLAFVNKSIIIPIPIEDCVFNNWHNVSIYIEPNKGYARLQINKITKDIHFEGLKIDTNCKYIFGVCDHYIDISPFAIRDLLYIGDGKDHFIFPLDEESGNIIYDDKGVAIGSANNPVWIYSKHCNWELMAEWTATEIVAIAHDKVESKILVYNSEYSHVYDIKNSQLKEQEHNFSSRFKLPNQSGVNYYFNNRSSDLFMYNNNNNDVDIHTIATYNYKNNTLKLLSRNSLKNQLHHNSAFVNKTGSKIYQFGGYGHYSYHNKFRGYDLVSNKWVEEKFSGDTISPRFYTSVSSNFRENTNDVYLFGGYGNNSGHQDQGGEYLYDLYKINLDNQSVENIANFNVGFKSVPGKNLILNRDENSFFTLLYPQYKVKSSIALYNFNWDTGEYIAVSDSIPLISRKITTTVNLFRDETANVFICAIQEYIDKDNSNIKLYRLLSPPPTNNAQQSRSKTEEKSRSNSIILLLLFTSICIAAVLYLYKKRESKKSSSKVIISESEQTVSGIAISGDIKEVVDSTPILSNHINSIYLTGEFTAINRDNRDVSYLFSTKIRQLFLLILMYTLRSNSKSISSNELSAILWPDKDINKAKNIRGVSIRNLRNILSEIDGINLVHTNSRWFFELDSNILYCDYIQFMCGNIPVINDDTTQNNTIEEYMTTLQRGAFLKSEEYPWLDSFKAEYEDRVIQIFHPIMLHHYQLQEYKLSYKFAQLLINHAPLNEDFARIEIKSLEGMGDYVKAKVRFRQFALNYYYACNKNLSYEEFTS